MEILRLKKKLLFQKKQQSVEKLSECEPYLSSPHMLKECESVSENAECQTIIDRINCMRLISME